MTGLTRATVTHGLQEHLKGVVLTPGDPAYDDARTLFNAMIDVKPAVIAQCAGPDDVRTALRFGRENDLEIAVRSGGHSVAGMSTVEDGLVIDVRMLKGVDVDPVERVARCGGGVTWAEFDRATQEHGLATTGGRVSTTGVAGFTLGGGSGWLERRYGLACDNLRAVELVTADGSLVRASRESHPDLFWALHGGGGNFGIATAFEFEVHPVGPIVLAGLMLWPAERGLDVITGLRDLVADAPEELATAGVFLTGPPEPFVPEHLQGKPCCGLAFMWAGEPEGGEPYAAKLRELKPEVDLIGPMPYAEFNSMIDDPPGFRNYWTADYLDEFTDDAVATFVEQSMKLPGPGPCQSLLVPWGGAVANAGPDTTPMSERGAQWISHPFALWEDPSGDDAHMTWAREMSAAMKQHASGGVYLNFIGREGEDRVKAAFGDSYDRLAQIKKTYDPDNVFRGNQNIKPAA